MVEKLGRQDLAGIVAVLCDAFADYPVMRFVLGGGAANAESLRQLIEYFATARILRREPVLGVRVEGNLAAAALVSFPGQGTSPPELHVLRDALWNALGADARMRYETFTAAAEPFAMDVPHANLNMIGVRHSHHGSGLGRRVMNAVHALAAETPGCSGVTLTTENQANVPFYERLGYRLLGRARVADSLETWAFYRPNAPHS